VTEPYRQNGKPMVEDGREINTTELMLQLDGVEALQRPWRMRWQMAPSTVGTCLVQAWWS
jgi:hypothetical protein